MPSSHLHPASRPVTRRAALTLPLGLLALPASLARAAGPPESAWADETWADAWRQRAVAVRLRWPDGATPGSTAQGRPVVLFSHGLGGTRAGAQVWGEAWAAAGFVVVHLQHPGSDFDAVRGATSSFTDRAALRKLAGPAQLLARLEDVVFALDEIGRRHAAGQGPWQAVRPQGVGLAGHSFGAHTTLGMAGQRYPGHPGFSEPRLGAFIAFSPTLPVAGSAEKAFERITRPTLCITGTRDDDVVGVGATPERRIGVFAALPAGHKAQLVLHDADHMTFAGDAGARAEIIPRDEAARRTQPQHHALVAALTTDWWRAQLRGDAGARARLAKPQGLGAGDVWQVG